MKRRIPMISLILIWITVLSGCRQSNTGSLPFYNTPDFMPQWIASTDKAFLSIHTIAPFTFINQQGKTITNRSVAGKTYVANFFFSRCSGICPRMNNNLKKVAKAFANTPDVLILSHSVTPETDSVAQLAQYGEQKEIDAKKWWLLTGNKEAIYTLARKSYFADEATGYFHDSNEFLHTENAVLIDRKGRIRGVYNATLELEINKLIEHIQQLLDEE